MSYVRQQEALQKYNTFLLHIFMLIYMQTSINLSIVMVLGEVATQWTTSYPSYPSYSNPSHPSVTRPLHPVSSRLDSIHKRCLEHICEICGKWNLRKKLDVWNVDNCQVLLAHTHTWTSKHIIRSLALSLRLGDKHRIVDYSDKNSGE